MIVGADWRDGTWVEISRVRHFTFHSMQLELFIVNRTRVSLLTLVSLLAILLVVALYTFLAVYRTVYTRFPRVISLSRL